MRVLLPFTKYHGLGNDFVLIDARELVFDPGLAPLLFNWSRVVKELAPRICNRHYGVGADGIILAMPLYSDSETEPFEPQARAMRGGKKLSGEFPSRHTSPSGAVEPPGGPYFATQYRNAVASLTSDYPQVDTCELSWVYTNSDGSNAVMCGNGLRCLALWARLRGGVQKKEFKIATAKGAIEVQFSNEKRICVDVGEPVLEAENIPAVGSMPIDSSVIEVSIDAGGNQKITVVAVGMGNPHGVIFDEKVWDGWTNAVELEGTQKENLKDPDLLDGDARQFLTTLAQSIQNNPGFPQGVNVEFVQTVSRDNVRCYVFERGCGFTLACASGAAAVVVAGVLKGLLDRTASVRLPGGVLEISFSEADGHIRITGPAQEIFSGVFKLEHLTDIELGSESKAEANCK